MKRPRPLYLLACVVIIALGLASRRFGHALPDFVARYAGDTLWALLIYLAVGFLFPRWTPGKVFTIALLFCFADETGQLYHASWIDSLRHTRLGGLILGYGFLWSDLACYTVGVALGWLAEKLFQKNC
jgi:hypothetical protein